MGIANLDLSRGVVSGAAPSGTISECEWRSRSGIFVASKERNSNPLVSDVCGSESLAFAEARAHLAERKSISSDVALNDEIVSMTEGYPIERMALAIAGYDREVAALLVGIAKKESNWGKRVPRSPDGTDCFNYWGFKGAGSRGTAMGHGCFGTPEEAVEKVGNRVAELVRIRETSEPKNFTIWKCGSSCATHSPESVRKWISDVDQYYRVLASK